MSMGSNISAEKLFKKMHSDKIGKVIDLSLYYRPNTIPSSGKHDDRDISRIQNMSIFIVLIQILEYIIV